MLSYKKITARLRCEIFWHMSFCVPCATLYAAYSRRGSLHIIINICMPSCVPFCMPLYAITLKTFKNTKIIYFRTLISDPFSTFRCFSCFISKLFHYSSKYSFRYMILNSSLVFTVILSFSFAIFRRVILIHSFVTFFSFSFTVTQLILPFTFPLTIVKFIIIFPPWRVFREEIISARELF